VKIIIKEISKNDKYLVYLTTNDGINSKCLITPKSELAGIVEVLNMKHDISSMVSYDYEAYIKQ